MEIKLILLKYDKPYLTIPILIWSKISSSNRGFHPLILFSMEPERKKHIPTVLKYLLFKIYVTFLFCCRQTFLDPETGKILVEGQTYVRPKFAQTLRELAEKGLQIFYNGTLAERIVVELQSMGGIITLEDLKNYT
jgi:hypothetical protein